MRIRRLALAAVSLLAAMLGACGTDDDGSRDSGLAAVELTEDWGCGYGFAVSDAAQEAMLIIHHNGGSASVDRTVTFPDPAWEAHVNVGTHLAANWCNDLIEDPQADVDEIWQIVEGTLTFSGELPSFRWSDGQRESIQPVRAELTGVVVEGPGGERVELGDVSLSNGSWGFLAG